MADGDAGSLAQPLLDDPLRLARQPSYASLLSRIGIENASEATIVANLALQSFLANSVFVLGRNLGPVLFMQECGADQLTGALLVGGLSVLISAPTYSRLSAGKLAAHTNFGLTLFCAVLLLVLAVPLLVGLITVNEDSPTTFLHFLHAVRRLRYPCAYGMYLAQDLLTLLLMMQSASLGQAVLNSYLAKRLLGLVQLGCSIGAVATGLAAGWLAHTIGTNAMILVQVRAAGLHDRHVCCV